MASIKVVFFPGYAFLHASPWEKNVLLQGTMLKNRQVHMLEYQIDLLTGEVVNSAQIHWVFSGY